MGLSQGGRDRLVVSCRRELLDRTRTPMAERYRLALWSEWSGVLALSDMGLLDDRVDSSNG